MEIEIQKGIPIPTRKYHGVEKVVIEFPFVHLLLGRAFFVPTSETEADMPTVMEVRGKVATANAKLRPKEFDLEPAPAGYRIRRTR